MTGHERIRAIAGVLGCNVVVVDRYDKRLNCPFNGFLGVDFPRDLIVCGSDPDRTDVVGAIHELGHLICTRSQGGAEDVFFGWEFAVASRFGIVDDWIAGNKDYYWFSGDGEDPRNFGSFDPDEQTKVLEQATQISVLNGFLREDGAIKTWHETWLVPDGETPQ